MQSGSPIKLKVPRQDLASFALFTPEPGAAREWAHALPVANTRAAVQQLMAALGDLNRHPLRPEVRHGVLETLRPSIDVTLQNLSRSFLNQPLVMPEEPRQRAEMAEELYNRLVTAYTVVAIEGLQRRDEIRDINPARLVCEAIQRTLDYAGRGILLTFQMYHPVERNGWLILHQLFALAERQALSQLPLTAADGSDTTVTDTYLQAVLLGCCKPNQLRQSDLLVIHKGLAQWSKHARLTGAEAEEGLFVVDLDSDQPPMYSALYSKARGSHFRRIDTSGLVTHLENLKAQDDKSGKQGIALERDTQLPSNMLTHLISSLGSMSMRNFSRSSSDALLSVSIGLSAAHYHAAGNQGFELLLHGSDYIPPPKERVATNPFLEVKEPQRDVWSEANPEEDFERHHYQDKGEEQQAHQVEVDEESHRAIDTDGPNVPEQRDYPVYEVKMANASPGGYCLDWPRDLPGDLKTGDLASIQEESGGPWVIAVIRWISNLQAAKTLVGLELLSPRATAYGAQIHHPGTSKSAPQRVLLLPEIPLVGQPHTLVTPRSGFREQQKLTLLREGETFHVQLLRQVAATSCFAQFDFRYVRELGDVIAEDHSDPLNASYDSLWTNI